ncbi:acylphosphatase [Synchytrium endobioticum]|uniref:Acylphosphatase n=1 Tax=Synchytrium endobioticum TaxID=286115 RepID=A0A507DR50_9FUNG|nr:acylphosphatase [Synchytrium endobioticum]TPX53408.1 acylphosphatase [Synchytrium endobioticum]
METASSSSSSSSSANASTKPLWTVSYQIHGKVQGVFFRKYTCHKGQTLGINGYVKNHDNGWVEGIAQGPKSQVEAFKKWISSEGSPKSRIDSFHWSNEGLIDKLEHQAFSIKD